VLEGLIQVPKEEEKKTMTPRLSLKVNNLHKKKRSSMDFSGNKELLANHYKTEISHKLKEEVKIGGKQSKILLKGRNSLALKTNNKIKVKLSDDVLNKIKEKT